jgi:para-nitrobenzyl esterase
VISGAYNESCVEPLLESDAGPVRGACCDGLAVFRGVPYPAPPVGALRFEPLRAVWDALAGEAA